MNPSGTWKERRDRRHHEFAGRETKGRRKRLFCKKRTSQDSLANAKTVSTPPETAVCMGFYAKEDPHPFRHLLTRRVLDPGDREPFHFAAIPTTQRVAGTTR